MNVIDLLPSPHYYFHSALSLVQSALSSTRREKVLPSRVDYDIDEDTGFLPPSPPPRLAGAYALWEHALTEAATEVYLWDDQSEDASEGRVSSDAWRTRILSWPVVDTEALHGNIRRLQRAHVVLAYLTHYYIHSAPPTRSDLPFLVPKALAVPFVTVSRQLGIAPVLTFADTVLWNYELIDAAKPLSAINIQYTNVFSRTEDESHFYLTSALVELRGIELLKIIDDYHSLPDLEDLAAISKLSRDLTRLVGIVADISDIIQSVRDTVDPHVFYHAIRPWFSGSDAKGPSSPGWIYEGVPNSEQLDLSGPSGGQSSVMHALDLFFDVDHKLKSRRFPVPSAENHRTDTGFMERMRRYMPGKHRDYLHSLANSPLSIRELAERTPALREPYDNAVMALKKLRDLHMRIACLYIVTMSRSSPHPSAACPVAAMMDRVQKSRGTGGNELALLLKASRDATRRTLLRRHRCD
ncbi:unnamed protein product [Mycena citricolor]|uniref:Indoleamine 2,3-dioxygenase n=1 Tax=Mycena citricolor TaxID=2018698 RepID=A0AAD2HLZ8_9AGAR|nr:unnamed protein product [Mycena citricolor]